MPRDWHWCFLIQLWIAWEAFGIFLDDTPPCGLPHVSPVSRRIVGGKEARVNSWPWMALMAKDKQAACGGSVLNKRLILTAVHCFANSIPDESPSAWTVYLGKHHVTTRDSSERSFNIQTYVPHPDFNNDTLENDIAIIMLDRDIEFSDAILPICIPPSVNHVVPTGTYCYVTGWGESRGTGDRNVLNQASVPILHDYWCSRQDWYGNKFLWKVTFCAGFKSGTKDACTGDSGGPLACKAKNGKWYVQGVTSWGYDCGKPRWPGIYTDVSVYAAWIRRTALSLGIPILNDD